MASPVGAGVSVPVSVIVFVTAAVLGLMTVIDPDGKFETKTDRAAGTLR